MKIEISEAEANVLLEFLYKNCNKESNLIVENKQ